MAITFQELKERLSQRVEETDMLELLQLTTSDLIEAFEDRIETLWQDRRLEEYTQDEEIENED